MTEVRRSSRPFLVAILAAIGRLIACGLCLAAKTRWVGLAPSTNSGRDFYVVRRDGKLIIQDEFTFGYIAQCRAYANVGSQSPMLGRAPRTYWNPRLVYEVGYLILPRSNQMAPEESSALTQMIVAERDKHAALLGVDLAKLKRNPASRGWESWSYEEADRRTLAWRVLDLAGTFLLVGSCVAGVLAGFFRWLQLRHIEGTCRGCGYPLHGIKTSTCPECGKVDTSLRL